MTPFEITTSAHPSTTGSSSATPSRNSTSSNPDAEARERSNIAGVMSTPTTLPSGPTALAAMKLSEPV
jgi:hypothetical protein